MFSAWRKMVAVNLLSAAALLGYKIQFAYPGEPYTQLLADYHFGFTKRALIGFLVSLSYPTLPPWSPYVVGSVVLGVTTLAFVWVFARTFGFSEQTLPVLIFIAGSPFFLKNFIQTLGYFDIYGCLAALLMLALPARPLFYFVGAAGLSAILILIHHIHMLLYVPTIAVITAARLATRPRPSNTALLVSASLALGLVALFLVTQFLGTASVPEADFADHLLSRMTDPTLRLTTSIYYQTLSEEVAGTRNLLPANLLRVPVYLALLLLHWPLARLLLRQIGGLQSSLQRRLIKAGIGLISFGYLIIFAVAYDYSRWVSNWSVCMMLLTLVTRTLPGGRGAPLIAAEAPKTRAAGWAVSLIPRVGTTLPF